MLKSQARFHLPKNCVQCDGASTIVLQTVVRGSSVLLAWICQACGRETPINLGQAPLAERRSGARDRRRMTRHDRRRSRSAD